MCASIIYSPTCSPPLFPVVFPLSFGTVHATDLDGDPVTYSLLHNLTIFTVSPAGGEVASLEEVTRAYTLTVVAVDSGTPSRTGSALIEVEGDSPVAPLIQGGSSNSVDLGVSISLGVGGFMILVGIIISIMVPVCVLKYIQQHGELRLASEATLSCDCHVTVMYCRCTCHVTVM